MQLIESVFGVLKPIIGMVHVLPLPGTPDYQKNDELILNRALEEASVYKAAGIDGLIIENMHDLPYLKRNVGPEITSFMTLIAHEIKKRTRMPCGIQILAGANQASLAVAKAAKLDFIRAEGFVFGHVADEGFMEADAGALLRYRKQIEANNIPIFTDIKKKHSAHSITADVDLFETAKAAAFFKSDALIITGKTTGAAANVDAIKKLKFTSTLPLLVGSGITLENIAQYFPVCDGLIVGSWFKEDGLWSNRLDEQRVLKMREKIKELRSI